MTDVLLGKPDYFRRVPLNAIPAVNQANQVNGVRCHFVEADGGLPSSMLTRDSSSMTPWAR